MVFIVVNFTGEKSRVRDGPCCYLSESDDTFNHEALKLSIAANVSGGKVIVSLRYIFRFHEYVGCYEPACGDRGALNFNIVAGTLVDGRLCCCLHDHLAFVNRQNPLRRYSFSS